MSANISIKHQLIPHVHIRRSVVFGTIIITALLAFEIFNYSTTEFALSDLLGDLAFLGFRWATILSIAFCGIDFAGIARLFTPQDATDRSPFSHTDTWYLFAAWLLAATMNAMLTWWGVSLAILGHQTLGGSVMARTTLVRVAPIFVSLLVWLIRVLIIGTFSASGHKLFSREKGQSVNQHRPITRPASVQKVTPTSSPASFSNNTPLRRPTGQYPNFTRSQRQMSLSPTKTDSDNQSPPNLHPIAGRDQLQGRKTLNQNMLQ